MIDIKLIKENYSRMTDAELIELAHTEGLDLTPEALDMLHAEFLSRRLDAGIFEQVDIDKVARQDRNIQDAQAVASDEFTKSIWVYAFDAKAHGITNEDIQKGLMEKGLDETHSSLITSTLESKAKENMDSYDSAMLRGGIICAVGLIITVQTYTSASNGGQYIIAWGAIIFGAIRFFSAQANKNKYKKIIEIIQSEETDIAAN